MKDQFHIISASSFMLICVLFFLPFLNIECGNQKLIVVSGSDLVTGFSMKVPSPDSGNNSIKKSDPNIYAVLALLFSILGGIFSIVLRGQNNLKTIVVTFAALTAASLIVLQIDMNSRISSEAKIVMVRINFEFGYWLCLIIPIILIVFSLLIAGSKKTTEEEKQSTSAT